MKISKFPVNIINLVQPAVVGLAMRLYVLTEGRKGKARAKPNIFTFYETGIVHSLYETMLMCPKLDTWDIRVEEKHSQLEQGRWVDLWLRDLKGGNPVRIEVGDLSRGKPQKANDEAIKLKALHKKRKSRSSWFLALIRDLQKEVDANRKKNELQARKGKRKLTLDSKKVLVARIEKSINRRNEGLDSRLIEFDKRLVRVFSICRPGAKGDVFGVILFKVKT